MSQMDWSEYDVGSFDEEELEKQETSFGGGVYVALFRFAPVYAFFRSGMAPALFPYNPEGKDLATAAKAEYNEATGESRRVLTCRYLEADAVTVLNRETEWSPSRITPGFSQAWKEVIKPTMQVCGLPTNQTWARHLCVQMVRDPGDTSTDEERKQPDGTVRLPRTTFRICKAYRDEEEAIADAEILKAGGTIPELEADEDAPETTPTGTTAASSGPTKPAVPSDWADVPEDWENEVKTALNEQAQKVAQTTDGKPDAVRNAHIKQMYVNVGELLGATAGEVQAWDVFLKVSAWILG